VDAILWMPFGGISPEGVYRQNRAGHAVFQPHHFPQKGQQAPPSALAKTPKQGAVVLEINPQHFGDRKNILPMGNKKQYVLV